MKASGKLLKWIITFCLAISASIGSTNEGPQEQTVTARLISNSPVMVRVPKLPSDPGHSLSRNLVERLSQRAQDKSWGNTTQSAEGGVLFALPVRKGISNSRPGFFAISNYVDQDMAAPDALEDYECGERTYDLDNGFNHNGTDYFNFPFSWLTMQQDGSVVVAAADGTIVQKHDGEPDMSCSFSDNAAANTIALEHADGSITIYAHLKRGSITSKGVGDSVERGDYLGIIGSSGFSDGPHLHFGVVDAAGNLIEPHQGACNSLNNESWWLNQEDYYEPGPNLIATHSSVPEFPECPGVENPNLEDSFSAGATIFLSAFFRDALMGETANLEVVGPSGATLVPWTFEYTDEPHAAALFVAWSIEFSAAAPSGAYVFRVTYGGVTREHMFYVDSGPDLPPSPVVSNNAQNGLFYDPGKDGEGYNFVTTPAGTIIYFYGSDQYGNRLWLISDLIPGEFGPGSTIEVSMFESTGGTFAAPVPSARGLSMWGTLVMNFEGCDNAEARLSGIDGLKVSQLVKLAGVAGTGCGTGNETSDSAWSGLWYALSDEGEGYNLIVAPNGSILYFYGFKSDGRRLWLISDLVVDELQLGVGVEAVMYEANQGDFDNPVPSDQSLVQWGMATITLIDCSNITIGLSGSDGNKTSVTIRLAGVIGLDCRD